MKKVLIFSAVLTVMAVFFTFMDNAFAAGVGGQSINVTVGEVDKIDADGNQDIDAPQTGAFGLGFNGDFVTTSVVLMVPVVAFVVFLSKNYHLRSKRNRLTRQNKSR